MRKWGIFDSGQANPTLNLEEGAPYLADRSVLHHAPFRKPQLTQIK